MTYAELLTAIANINDTAVDLSTDELIAQSDLLEQANAKIFELVLQTRTKKLMQEFGERESDIYVVTYPKSGTTLMQMILYQMTTDGAMDFQHLYDVSPWCRYSAFTNRPMASTATRRIIKTHDEYALMRYIGKGKFIFVLRDYADVIHSLHQHLKDYNNPNTDFDELNVRKMPDWFRYNNEWIKNEAGLDLLYVRYEDIVADKKEIIKQIAGFIQAELNEEIMTRTLHRSSFEFMKTHEGKFGEQPEHWKVYNNFIRQGKAGAGKALLSAEQSEKYKAMLADCKPGNPLAHYRL